LTAINVTHSVKKMWQLLGLYQMRGNYYWLT